MGSKFSKSNNEENNTKDKFKTNKYQANKKYIDETENLSLFMQTKENTNNSSITTTTEINFDISQIQQKFVEFTFQWKGDCKTCQLTGTFANDWKKFIDLNKNPETGIYEKKIKLPKMKHFFKFVVDTNWVCSNQYPTISDENNNLNNFIDLTNYNPPEDSSKNQKNKNEENIINNNILIEEKNKNILKKYEKKKKNYDCKYPLNNELNTTAPTIISHYKPYFDIDYQSKQDCLKLINNNNIYYINYCEKNFNTENNTFKKIMVWPHEKLMHLCPNLEDLSEENENYLKICTTIRNKHKYLTLVYYKPK